MDKKTLVRVLKTSKGLDEDPKYTNDPKVFANSVF